MDVRVRDGLTSETAEGPVGAPVGAVGSAYAGVLHISALHRSAGSTVVESFILVLSLFW